MELRGAKRRCNIGTAHEPMHLTSMAQHHQTPRANCALSHLRVRTQACRNMSSSLGMPPSLPAPKHGRCHPGVHPSHSLSVLLRAVQSKRHTVVGFRKALWAGWSL